MIFYNNQLMKNREEMNLFICSNPVPFTRYEDHAAAMFSQVSFLVEMAMEKEEDPVYLMEEILQLDFYGNDSVESIASFILSSHQMEHAMSALQNNWGGWNGEMTDDGIARGNGISRDEVIQCFASSNLRIYLENLKSYENV